MCSTEILTSKRSNAYMLPAITVADALELDVLIEGQAIVLAGEGNLDRRIRWAHISDLPTAAPTLRGGELLLTHGLGLRQSESLQRRYVRDLEQVPIAGLVIELGRGFDRPPVAMVEEARNSGLPMIALRKRIRFVDLTEQVHGEILRRHYREVDTAQELGRELMEVTRAGGGLRPLLRALSEGLRNPVVLEDAAHQVLDYASYDADPAPVISDWASHSHLSHQDQESTGRTDEHRGRGCASEQIVLRSLPWGRIHVLEIDTELGPRAPVAVQYCALAVALTLLEEAHPSSLAEHVGGNLVAEVMAGTLSPAEVIDRSRVLGCDLSKSVAAIAIEMVEIDGDAPSQRESRLALERLSRKTLRGVRSAGGNSLSHLPDDSRSLLLLVGAGSKQQLSNVLDAVVGAVSRAIDETWVVRLGLSEQADARRLPDAIEHAQVAASLAGGTGPLRTASYSKLGIERLFVKLSDGPELASYVESELGPILQHDAVSKIELLPVLETYLAAGCSKSEAARELFISRRSLYHRLGSIEALLGYSLEEASTRTSLEVAIQALRTLQKRPFGPKRFSTRRKS